jgi:hypothetical protein
VRKRFVLALLVVFLGARLANSRLEDVRDMRLLASFVRAADAPGAPPPLLLAGRDLHGLDFQLDGRLVRVGAIEIETHNARTTLARAAAANDASGLSWLLIYEDDELERRAIHRVLGDRTELVARTGQMCVRRIVPPAR